MSNPTTDKLIEDTVNNLNTINTLTEAVASQRKELTQQIKPGNTYPHALASVQITQQTETRTDPLHLIPTFNAAAYTKLSAVEKTRLTKLGIVSLLPKVTKGQDPVCRITLVK